MYSSHACWRSFSAAASDTQLDTLIPFRSASAFAAAYSSGSSEMVTLRTLTVTIIPRYDLASQPCGLGHLLERLQRRRRDAVVAGQAQGELQFGEETAQHVTYPLLAGEREPVRVRAGQEDGPGTH